MTDTVSSYQGLYINLDRSPERRARIERQLRTLGLEKIYRRFPAVDGAALKLPNGTLRPGEVGAFLSHTRALETALTSGTAVHILEDDALLSEHVRPVVEDAVSSGLFDRFDILFTDTFVSCHIGLLKFLKTRFDATAASPNRPLRLNDLQVMDLAGQNFSCLTSYAVGRKSIERVHALCRQELASGPRMPVDLFIRDCVNTGKLRAACVAPFVTSFELDEIAGSTIVEDAASPRPSVMVLAALRYSYFVGRDLALAKSYMDAATRMDRGPRDAHRELIVQALEFVLSDEFKEF